MPDPTDVFTLLAHDDLLPGSGIVPELHQTSLFPFASYADMRATFAGERRQSVYSRGDNPTVQRFEAKVAELEGAEAARAFSSGMGAISATVLSHVAAGDRIVCVRNVYPDAYKLLRHLLPRFGVETTFVDARDTDAVARSLPGARLLYLENPTSQVFELQDVPRLARLAHDQGATVVLDNSWASPLFQRPLTAGADVVLHSASKYLSGHSDVVAGVAAGSAAAIARVNDLAYGVLGAKLAPFEAWLLLRGLRTLPLRMARHRTSAIEVARFLAEHPAVDSVLHPALAGGRQGELFDAQFTGSSGLFSFRLRDGDEARVARFVDALRLFRLGVSWGGHESLVYPAAVGRFGSPTPTAASAFDVPRDLVRLHVGLEDPGALRDDLAAALDAA